MSKIVLKTHGHVDERDVKRIKNIILRVYNKAKSARLNIPLIIELHIFEDDVSLNAFIELDAMSRGVRVYSKGFMAYHDAWSGIPRLFFSLKSLNNLNEDVSRGIIEHEAMHSIIHGDVRYYIISLPLILYRLVNNNKITLNDAWLATYLASVAIKDYEVTLNLTKLGFIKSQVKYHEYMLKEEEHVEGYVHNVIVNALIHLKPLASAIPLINTGLGNYINNLINEYINRIPSDIGRYIYKLMELIPKLHGDLDSKISQFFESLVKYIDSKALL